MNRLAGSVGVALGLGWLADGTALEIGAAAVALFAFALFLDRVGRRIAILECMGAIAALELLFVPAVTYWLVPSVMAVESAVYFAFMLPAYVAFGVGLFWFSRREKPGQHRRLILAATAYLEHKRGLDVVLLLIGLTGFAVKLSMLNAPGFVSTLPYNCLFVSVLYAHYAKSPVRLIVNAVALLALLMYTVREGMFGDLFMWVLLLSLFMLAGLSRPLPMRLTGLFTMVALLILLLIQSIKMEYRVNTWGRLRTERNGNAGLLASLLYDRLQHPEKLFNVVQVFGAFTRFNQGLIVGHTMAIVPINEPYARGEVLRSLVHPFVPRFVWADKPVTGGYENIRRFTALPQHKASSTNISPIGEGYVNFGYGGILFALAYGLLLGGCFRLVERLTVQTPSIILWLPALFVGCLTMETDLLSTWGSLVNAAVFTALLYWVLNRFAITL